MNILSLWNLHHLDEHILINDCSWTWRAVLTVLYSYEVLDYLRILKVTVCNLLHSVELEAYVVNIICIGLSKVVEVKGDGISAVSFCRDRTGSCPVGPLCGE